MHEIEDRNRVAMVKKSRFYYWAGAPGWYQLGRLVVPTQQKQTEIKSAPGSFRKQITPDTEPLKRQHGCIVYETVRFLTAPLHLICINGSYTFKIVFKINQ